MKRAKVYGIMAEFDSVNSLLDAANRTREAGYKRIDAYSPYPVNVGGKPYHSWPSFIIVTFEMTILFAGISAVFGMLALNGLPMPYHPVFNSPRFAFASKDRFFLIVFSSDPKYKPSEVRGFLESLRPRSISEVPD